MWLRKTLPAKKGVSIVATLCGPSAWPNPPNHVFTHPSHYVFTHPYTRLSTCPRHSRTAREQLANNSRTSKNTVFCLKPAPADNPRTTREQSANNPHHSRTIREHLIFPSFMSPLLRCMCQHHTSLWVGVAGGKVVEMLSRAFSSYAYIEKDDIWDVSKLL